MKQLEGVLQGLLLSGSPEAVWSILRKPSAVDVMPIYPPPEHGITESLNGSGWKGPSWII